VITGVDGVGLDAIGTDCRIYDLFIL